MTETPETTPSTPPGTTPTSSGGYGAPPAPEVGSDPLPPTLSHPVDPAGAWTAPPVEPPAAPTAAEPSSGWDAPPVPPPPPPSVAPSPPPPGAADPAAGWSTPAQVGPGRTMGGFDAAALQNFDPKTVNPFDWGIMGAGIVAFLLSFFGYYEYSAKVSFVGVSQSQSATWSAWHGFFGWAAALLALAAAGALAASVIAKMTFPFDLRLIVLGGFGVALLCTILALVVIPAPPGFTVVSGIGFKTSKGHAFGYWLSLLVILAGTGLAFVRFRDSGRTPRSSLDR